MIMHFDTDAAYLVFTEARSRISCHFYPSDCLPTNDTPNPKINVPIITICQTLKHVVASAAEAETGGTFLNGQAMVPIWHTLIKMDHPELDNENPLNSDRKL